MFREYIKKLTPLNKGFTFGEVMLIITILPIISMTTFVSLQGQSSDARDMTRRQEVDNLVTKINMARANGVSLINLVTDTASNRVSGIVL